MRIIGGRWRGRKLAFPDGEGLRPTGDRIRETLFNWLAPIMPGARCLDAFAGSGALGFEALSRGAASCVMLESNAGAARGLQASATLLAADEANIINTDALSWLARAAAQPFDVVFLDPPFADASLDPVMLVDALAQRNLLAEDVWLYVEQPANAPQTIAAGFVQHRSQKAGRVRYSLWRKQSTLLVDTNSP